MALTAALASIASFGFAILIMAANPKRPVNRAFAFGVTIAGLWLVCVTCAIREREAYILNEPNNAAFWLRANVAVVSFLPVAIGMISAAVSGPEMRRRWRIINALLTIGGLFAAWITTLPSFLYPTPDGHLTRGTSYYVLSLANCLVYFGCLIFMFQQLPRIRGIRRLELKLVALSSAGTCLALSVLNAVGNYFHIGEFKQAGIVTVVVALVVLGWALLFRRVFDAREIVARLARSFFEIICTAVILFGVWHLSGTLGSGRIVLVVLIAAPVALLLHHHSRAWFYGTIDRRTETLRQRLFGTASIKFTPNTLRNAIGEILATEFAVQNVTIAIRDDPDHSSSRESVWVRKEFQLLFELGWATPESLERMRPNSAIAALQEALSEERASLGVCAPRGSRVPSLLAIFGERRNDKPFTYPEVTRLFGLLELIDNILTRSRLTEQAALQARVEHLAMMSRGLAHDLKNLITPVSSFLIHTEGKYAPDSPEAEVHAAARRSVRIMTDYVREALFFSERLAPKFELVAVPRILSAVVEITAPRACRRGVNVATACDPGLALIADNVLLQRMLANFVTNAIDASPPDATVTLSAAVHAPDRISVQISDRGCGIAPEHLPRIFDAYFTTKEFGDEIRGFGLGLTIARKIADLHSATISVKSRLGEGTTIAVDVPARQAIALAAPAPHCVIADTAVS